MWLSGEAVSFLGWVSLFHLYGGGVFFLVLQVKPEKITFTYVFGRYANLGIKAPWGIGG